MRNWNICISLVRPGAAVAMVLGGDSYFGKNAPSWGFCIYGKKQEVIHPCLEVLEECSSCNHEEEVAF
jgi:hypothetical protein